MVKSPLLKTEERSKPRKRLGQLLDEPRGEVGDHVVLSRPARRDPKAGMLGRVGQKELPPLKNMAAGA